MASTLTASTSLVPSSILRKLQALEYPEIASFSLEDADVYKLVSWIEDEKIRFYSPEERPDFTSENTKEIYDTYLDELGCIRTNRLAQIDWLISHAIHFEYNDNAAQINKNAQEVLSLAVVSRGVADLSTSDGQSKLDNNEEIRAAVAALAQAMRLPALPVEESTTHALEVLLKIIARKYSPEAIEQQNQLAASGASKPSLEELALPLGFNTSDPLVNQVATVLRLWHTSDLRDLQTQINQLIVSVQNLTANPRTDNRLGKVGL